MNGARRAWLAVLVLAPTLAAACPDCEAGQLARASFWSGGPLLSLAALLLPFVVTAAALAAIWPLAGRLLCAPPGPKEHA